MEAEIRIIGRLGADPEQRFIQSGTSVVDLSVAVRRKYRKDRSDEENDKPVWYKVTIWGTFGERLMSQLRDGKIGKGALVTASGTFEPEEFTRRDGNPGITYAVNADRVRVLHYDQDGSSQQRQGYQQGTASGRRQQDRGYQQANTYDEVPF